MQAGAYAGPDLRRDMDGHSYDQQSAENSGGRIHLFVHSICGGSKRRLAVEQRDYYFDRTGVVGRNLLELQELFLRQTAADKAVTIFFEKIEKNS